MDRSSFGDVLRHHLDPVLAPYGFASGTGESLQITFCAAADRLAERLPALPWDRWDHGPGCCTDVLVDGDDGDRIVRAVSLEGDGLTALLRVHGLEVHAAAVDDVLGASVERAAPVLADALGALLRAADRRVG